MPVVNHDHVRRTCLTTPPKTSKATIRPPLRSKASVRGAFVNDATDTEFVYASTLERDAAHILLAHPDVDEVREQPPAVTYLDDRGKPRKHTFDLLVRLRDGTRVAMAVKPLKEVASKGLDRTIALIRANPPADFADRFEIKTEKQICRVRAANGRLVLHARRMRDDAAVAAAAAFVATMRGHMTVDAVCAALPDLPAAFMAVVNLVDDGRLRVVGGGRIAASATVEATTSH